MSQNHGMPIQSETDSSVTVCSNCRTPMPRNLRFCRNCGYRLGEGLAEYTETVRFENGRPVNLADHGPASSQQPFATAYGVSGGSMSPAAGHPMAKRAKKMSGMTWMFIGLLIFFIAAAAFTAVVTPIRRNIGGPTVPAPPPPPRAMFGVSSFEDAEGGVTFDSVLAPGSPADKAGLVGGDVITSFDGQVVHDDDEMTDLVQRTPIGKAVEVIYIRDGESKTTTLTTVSKGDFDRLVKEFRDRPEGRGLFGFDDDTERVPIPGTKIFGAKVKGIEPNQPADLAGVKKGDIIIEFGGTPIRTPEELASRVLRALPYSTVTVVLMRGDDRVVIPVKMGKRR